MTKYIQEVRLPLHVAICPEGPMQKLFEILKLDDVVQSFLDLISYLCSQGCLESLSEIRCNKNEYFLPTKSHFVEQKLQI